MNRANRKRRRRPPARTPGVALIFVTRCQDAAYVPHGYTARRCSKCDRPVWVSRITLRIVQASGLRLTLSCNVCTEDRLGDLL